MSRTVAILGKGGVGKTFVAAHLAMAMSYLGQRTLLVGCDQKQDTVRAVSAEQAPSLMQALELAGWDYEAVPPEQVLVRASDYVDVVEMGPSALLVGDYGSVLEEAFHLFGVHRLLQRYDLVLFDVGEERFDAAYAPLFRRVEAAVAVTDDSPEAMFVVNRLMRAVLIGAYEHGHPLRLLGAVCNRSLNPLAFQRFTERTRCFPLLTIPESAELGHLRPFHRTVFGLERRSESLEAVLDGFVKVSEILRGRPFNLQPVMPLEDEEVWELAPPVSLPS